MNAAPVTRKLRFVTCCVAVAAVVALLLWQIARWDGAGSPDGSDAARAASNTGAGFTMFSPDERPDAPVLEGETLDGDEFNVKDWAGNVVVINVWGSWCGPCRAETPDLVRVAEETADRGVRFVGINTRDDRAAANAFVREFQVPYPSVFDADGRALLPFQLVVPSAAVPSTIVVDPDGKVAARVIGAVTYSTLSGLIDDLTGSTR